MKCVWPRIRFPPSGISSGTIFSSINAILLRCAAGAPWPPPAAPTRWPGAKAFIIDVVPPLTFTQARETVVAAVRAARPAPATEEAGLEAAAGRVLAEDIAADRDVPATARSVRDGYAVRAIDLPGELEIMGEVRAGERFAGAVGPGQAVEIMTGAPVPAGADAVVMIEHTVRESGRVRIGLSAEPRQFINPQASEAAAHEVVLRAGKRLDYSGV